MPPVPHYRGHHCSRSPGSCSAIFSRNWACIVDRASLYPRPISPPTQMEPSVAIAQTDCADNGPGTTATSSSRHRVGRRQVVGGRSPRGSRRVRVLSSFRGEEDSLLGKGWPTPSPPPLSPAGGERGGGEGKPRGGTRRTSRRPSGQRGLPDIPGTQEGTGRRPAPRSHNGRFVMRTGILWMRAGLGMALLLSSNAVRAQAPESVPAPGGSRQMFMPAPASYSPSSVDQQPMHHEEH